MKQKDFLELMKNKLNKKIEMLNKLYSEKFSINTDYLSFSQKNFHEYLKMELSKMIYRHKIRKLAINKLLLRGVESYEFKENINYINKKIKENEKYRNDKLIWTYENLPLMVLRSLYIAIHNINLSKDKKIKKRNYK